MGDKQFSKYEEKTIALFGVKVYCRKCMFTGRNETRKIQIDELRVPESRKALHCVYYRV